MACAPTRVFRPCRGASAFPYRMRSLHERGRGHSPRRSTHQTVSSGVQLHDTAVGARDSSVEFRLFRVPDSDIEAKQTAEALELDVVRSGDLEAIELAADRRVDGRVYCTRAPFDEKWEETGVVVFEIQGLPFQQPTVGSFARAWGRAIERDVCGAQTRGQLGHVAGMSGPADQARPC